MTTENITPLIREKLIETGKADRILTCPFIDMFGAKLINKNIREVNLSGELMADLEIEAYKIFGHDSVSVGPGLYGVPEALGVKLGLPENSYPYVINNVDVDYNHIEELPVADPYKDGRLPLFLDGVKKLLDEVKHEVSVGSSVAGPFSTAATVIGTERFLKDIRKNPEAIHKLLAQVTKSVLAYMDAVMDLGVVPSMPDPVASGTLISTKTFSEFALPYLETCVEHIRSRMGRGPTLHICGTTKKHWPEIKKLNLSALSLDNIDDIGEACDTLGDKFCIVGNVDPVKIMLKGTKETIYAAVKECIDKAWNNPKGFVLATGCDIPINAPVENVHFFMEAARLYSRFRNEKTNR